MGMQGIWVCLFPLQAGEKGQGCFKKMEQGGLEHY